MPKAKSATDYYRQRFETVYGKSIRHDQWLQICQEMRGADLKLDIKTIEAYASFKKANPRKPLTKNAIQNLETFTQEYSPPQAITGKEITSFIEKLMPGLGGYSLYKSFYKAGLSFKADRTYSFEEAYLVLTFAFTIRPKRSVINV
ncbi:hypothetical protein [Tolypothrix sp. VBCCA 56010]|uniref:hypothetical protein n=1 Tax=Tolypothrix sp. VBCCA 56010 TaxID=3137731 RepID=UPI003D7E66B5